MDPKVSNQHHAQSEHPSSPSKKQKLEFTSPQTAQHPLRYFQIHFFLQNNIPHNLRNSQHQKFLKIVKDIHGWENTGKYIQKWIETAKYNKSSDILPVHSSIADVDLTPLNRSEGGIGGNNNITDRQIRFFDKDLLATLKTPKDDLPCAWEDIVLTVLPSDDGLKYYTYEEAYFLADAFKQTLAHMMNPKIYGTGFVNFRFAFSNMSQYDPSCV